MSTDVAYEILIDRTRGTTWIYRSVRAGVCAPWTTPTIVADRTGAEAEALRYGLVRSGPWTRSTFEDVEYAPAAPALP